MFKVAAGDRYLEAAGITADWPYGRGMYVSGSEDFFVWVGEEDHLRIISMNIGGKLRVSMERLRTGLEILEDLLPTFATSPRYGNVTSCPTNLGSGLRTSPRMRLPRLTSDDRDLARLKRKASALGLEIRGAGGEHTSAGEDGLVEISLIARFGVTLAQSARRLGNGIDALKTMEPA